MKKFITFIWLFFTIEMMFAQPAYVTMTGGNDHISVPDNPLWDVPGDFTFSMRVNFTTTNGWHMLLTHHDGIVPQGFEFSYVGGVIRLSPEGYTVAIDAPWNPLPDIWYHLVLTRDADTMRVFVDGSQIGTAIFNGLIHPDDFPLMIGNYYYPGYAFIGKMDEVSIWQKSATLAFVNNTLAHPLAGNEPYLVAYYDMDTVGAGVGIPVRNKAINTGNALDGITVGTDTTPFFTQLPPPPPTVVPLSDWAILIGIFLMIFLLLIRIRKA